MRKPAATPAAQREPVEIRLSVDEVRALEIGNRVTIHGADTDGNQRELACTVAGLPGNKFLTYRITGKIKRCAIKDYPGKYYTRTV